MATRRFIFKSRIVLEIMQADLTEVSCDILVNCSNKGLTGSQNLKAYWMFAGRKNVDTAIHNLAGPQLQQDCDSIDYKLTSSVDPNTTARYTKCDIGEVWITLAHGGLKSKVVAHTVSPRYYDMTDDECRAALTDSYSSVFLASALLRAKTVCFPAIGCGICEVPPRISASAFIAALSLGSSSSTTTTVLSSQSNTNKYTKYNNGKLSFDSKSSLLIESSDDREHPNLELTRVICCMKESKTYWAWIKAVEESPLLPIEVHGLDDLS
eukprot:gene27613-36415_t